ncbi:MAG TPA: DUF3857 domain-containing protein [Thermoanaerobaculia bacterium]
MSRIAGKAFAALVPALFLLLTAPSIAAPPAGTAEPWEGEPFAGDPAAIARAAARVEAGEGDVVVLLADALYSYDEAGRETYTQRLVYRVVSQRAHESWSAVEEDWAPWHQERPEIRARVITPDGVAHPFDPANLAENAAARSAPDMFEDGRILRGPLPAIRPGAVVEQVVSVRDKAPFFDGGVVRFHSVERSVRSLRVRVTLDAPESLPLRWVARKLPGAQPRETVAGGRRRLTLDARDVAPWKRPEPGLPADQPRWAYVAFSTGRSWGELARRYSDIVDQAIQGSDLTPLLRSAGVPAGSQLGTIQRLLARVSEEVRYTGVELGEGSLVPRKPAETLRRKFGDCKDKAVLLVALLRASDIPAYVALLNAGEGDSDVEESLPGFGMFNHAIVVVPGSPAIWIDPTDPYARAGELPVGDQGRLALIASPNATGLTRTPEPLSADNREIEVREFFLADLGPARIVETSELRGAAERDLRSYYAESEADDVREELESYARETYRAEAFGAVEHSGLSDLSGPLRLRIEVQKGGRGFTDPRNAAVGVKPADLLARLPKALTGDDEEEEEEEDGEEEPATRRSDFVFNRPMKLEVRYRIVPPAGYAPRPLPTSRQRGLGTVTLSEQYAAGPDGVVTAVFKLDTGKRRLSPAEFETTRQAVREALDEKMSLLYFDQTGEAHLDAGQVREALAEFQRLAALEPKKALPRTRIARALLAGGMGEAAREEARRATQLEPGFAPAYHDLGWILQHDDLGRRFGPGFDRAGAIAAYRKAKQLDPQDDLGRADLAILLEHDAKGARYSPKADLAAAIAEYQALRKDLEDHDMDDNLLVALVRAGRFAEARELLKGLSGRTPNSPIMSLVTTAVLDGADAAVRQSERDYPDDKDRATALHQTGQNLIVLRRYPEAAALFERASRQSGNAASLLATADILRRTRRHEEIDLPAGDPVTVVRRLIKLVFAEERDVRQLASLFQREIEEDIVRGGDAFLTLFEAGFSRVTRQLQASNLPLDAALDLGLGAMRATVSGDDALGYRIAATSAMESSGAQRFFVVRQGQEYRIVGFSDSPSTLGIEALRRVKQGDLAGARQLLDWTLDEMGAVKKDADGLPIHPFLALWTRGSAAGAEEIRCAAAALWSYESEATSEVPSILLPCREAATDPARRNALDLALVSAYETLERYPEMEQATRRLIAAVPASERAEGLHLDALTSQSRWDEARAIAERRLQNAADHEGALRLLFGIAFNAGELDRAQERFQSLVDAGKASATDYNNMAWMLLGHGRVDDRTVEYAQRAVTLSDYDDSAHLHTLASIYAELGKTGEAYQLLVQSLAAGADDTPDGDDWYVVGRLAEHYGLPDVARKCYKRVDPPSKPADEALSTHALAVRRLAAMDAEGARAQARPAGSKVR